jgi:hypothetical protein
MPTTGSTITKQSLINDFIAAVMTPATNTSRFSTSNVPNTTQYAWASGQILPSTTRAAINQSALSSPSDGLGNPTTGNLPTNTITATEIVNVFRTYARMTTRIRNVSYGMYYTVYGNGQYARTGVPSDNPTAHAAGVISGTFSGNIALAHLTSSYLDDAPLSINLSGTNGVVNATNLNSFFQNLRTSASPSNLPTVDLRVCHSSCHNNCHGSRGRR